MQSSGKGVRAHGRWNSLGVTATRELHLAEFGVSPQHALRLLLTEFRTRGWRDPGDAALLVIRQIEKRPGITPERAAAAAPAAFFDVNNLRRRDLADALVEISRRR